MSDRVQIEIAHHVATVRLCRPEKRNALDPEMFAALVRAGQTIAVDREVRAVVLHGEGGHFCAGLDTATFGAFLGDAEGFRRRVLTLADGEVANDFQKCAYVWRELEIPVIAALEGVAFGGGLQIALGADLRVAAPDARLSVMEIKWGLIPDMGIMTVLPRLVRIDVAKELLWSGRVVNADEAKALGLVTWIDSDPLAFARQQAERYAAQSPDAVRGSKRLLEEGWSADHANALRLEATLQARLLGAPNQVEAVMANLDQRPPQFR